VAALSTTHQVEYISLVEGVKKDTWLKWMIGQLRVTQVCVKIHIAKVPSIWRIIMCDMRGKSTLIRMHFVRDVIEPKEIVVEKDASEKKSDGCVH
jgi:hypothetical protein